MAPCMSRIGAFFLVVMVSTIVCAAEANPCVLPTTLDAKSVAPETTVAANPEVPSTLMSCEAPCEGLGAPAWNEALESARLFKIPSACTCIHPLRHVMHTQMHKACSDLLRDGTIHSDTVPFNEAVRRAAAGLHSPHSGRV